MRYSILPSLVLAVLCGCVSKPPPAQPPPVQAAAARSEPSASSGQQAPTAAAGNPELLKRGYKTQMIRGELFYCRKDMITGSRFSSQICLTELQIKDQERNAKDNLNGVRACAGPDCRGAAGGSQ
jgi:hypothetical protein